MGVTLLAPRILCLLADYDYCGQKSRFGTTRNLKITERDLDLFLHKEKHLTPMCM